MDRKIEVDVRSIVCDHQGNLKEKLMESENRNTQLGTLLFVVYLVTGVLIVVVALKIIVESRWESADLMICIYLLGIALFYSFTIEISKEKLKFWFGVGVVRKSYLLSGIQSAREVINPWYYFWGVKSIPGRWFYAIAPKEAVEMVLKNGKVVQRGTNQSKRLKKTIDIAIQQDSDKTLKPRST